MVNPLANAHAWVGLHHALAIAGLIWAGIRRDRRLGPYALWWLILFAAVAYGSFSLRSWKPILDAHPRFLAPIAVPAFVLGASLWERLRERGAGPRRVAWAILVVLVVYSAFLCARLERDSRLHFAGVRRGIQWLSGRPLPAGIYTDWASARALTAFLGLDFPSEIRDYLEVRGWAGRQGLIFDNEVLRENYNVRRRQIDPSSLEGARLVARFPRDPPWRLRALLGLAPPGSSPETALSIWELPAGAGKARAP
jgi:hypothetical protein